MLTAHHHRRLRARSRLRCRTEILALLDAHLMHQPGFDRTVIAQPAVVAVH